MAVINPSAADVSRSIVQALEKEGEAVLRGGIYHSSPFSVPSHSRLVIEKDAELVFIPDFTLYPPVFTRWEGVQCWCMHPCIFINESEDVKIGDIDHYKRCDGGIMLGLGETEDEVLALMDDALAAGCSILTIGQYMQPSRRNIPVAAYIHPDQFAEYKRIGLAKGFRVVESAPLVRSSYCAERHVAPPVS